METNEATTYTGITKDWSLIWDLTSIDNPLAKNAIYFIKHQFSHLSNSGKTKYYRHIILNPQGEETEINVGKFTIKLGNEYWLSHQEEEKNEMANYIHYIKGVPPDKAKDIKIDFYYPTNLDLVYKFVSPRERLKDGGSAKYLFIQSVSPYGSKCCGIRITNTQTNSINIGRIDLSSADVPILFTMLCEELEQYNSIPDWRTKQLIDFMQPEINYIIKEIDNWNKDTLEEWYSYLDKFRNEFEFYLPFMKKRRLDIDEYLQLLESRK
jgi:hypothetical protein